MLLFATALGAHFLVVDYGLRDHHDGAYRRRGRWVVDAVLGWLLGATVDVALPVAAAVFAFLAGGDAMNDTKEELPEDRLVPFLVGSGDTPRYWS